MGRPQLGTCNVGHPPARWSDNLRNAAGKMDAGNLCDKQRTGRNNARWGRHMFSNGLNPLTSILKSVIILMFFIPLPLACFHIYLMFTTNSQKSHDINAIWSTARGKHFPFRWQCQFLRSSPCWTIIYWKVDQCKQYSSTAVLDELWSMILLFLMTCWAWDDSKGVNFIWLALDNGRNWRSNK